MQPEQPLRSRSIYDGRVVRLRVDAIRLPDGREVLREVVEHRASVVVVPIDSEGNVVLVRQYRYPVGQALLEAPAGVVEESEGPEECAQRELREEVGCGSRDLWALGGFWMSPGYCTEYMHAYLARDLFPSKLRADEDESIRVERLPVSRVPRLIRQGEIRDAKTVDALLMATCLYEST